MYPCRSTSRSPSHECWSACSRQEIAARDIIVVDDLNAVSEGRKGGGKPHKLLQAWCPYSGKGKETQPRYFTKSVQQSVLGKQFKILSQLSRPLGRNVQVVRNWLFLSQNSTHDKTPLLDTTNMTNVSTTSSNKSMTARIIGTPKSLKRNLTRAFTKRKYDVKGKNKWWRTYKLWRRVIDDVPVLSINSLKKLLDLRFTYYVV